MKSVNFIPILLGSDVNVYGMARSFHQEYGVRSLAVGKAQLMATSYSRIVKMATIEPNLEENTVFQKTLRSLVEELQPTGKKLLLLSCGDNYSRLIAQNQESLRPYYLFNTVDPKLLLHLSDKERFYQLCEKHDLSYPKTAIVTLQNYTDFTPEFPFPVIVKPSNSVAYWNCRFPNKKKVFLADSPASLAQILAAIYSSSYQEPLILQEYIPGDDSNMRVLNCYSDRTGQVRMVSLGRALLEEHTPEGIGSYAAILSKKDEALTQKIQAFLNKIEYRGYSNFDMKYDCRDQQYKVFEMNPRQGRSSFFVTAAGCNLARFPVEDLVEEKDLPLTIADQSVLWTLIPKDVLFTYLTDPQCVEEAKALYQSKKVCRSLFYKKDANPMRILLYWANQRHYREKYRKYFGKKGLQG